MGYVSKKFVNVSGESTNSISAEATNTRAPSTTETANVKMKLLMKLLQLQIPLIVICLWVIIELNNDADIYVLPVLYALKNGNLKKGDNVNVITVISNWSLYF